MELIILNFVIYYSYDTKYQTDNTLSLITIRMNYFKCILLSTNLKLRVNDYLYTVKLNKC